MLLKQVSSSMGGNIRIDLEEIDVNMKKWIDSTQDFILQSPCECGIVPPGTISHAVNIIVALFHKTAESIRLSDFCYYLESIELVWIHFEVNDCDANIFKL